MGCSAATLLVVRFRLRLAVEEPNVPLAIKLPAGLAASRREKVSRRCEPLYVACSCPFSGTSFSWLRAGGTTTKAILASAFSGDPCHAACTVPVALPAKRNRPTGKDRVETLSASCATDIPSSRRFAFPRCSRGGG